MSGVLLDPFYWDLRNKVIAPERSLAVTFYFLDRWAPILGADYTAAILQFRRLAQESPTRGEVEISQAELADRLGVSRRKFQRLFAPACFLDPDSWFLPLFVRLEHRWVKSSSTGRAHQAPNVYRIAIDDPLHPEDETELLPRLAPREHSDRAAQVPTALPIPSLEASQEELVARLRELVPTLVPSAVQQLLASVGPEVIGRQLEWFPHRDNSWAKNGPAAAFHSYCKQDTPEPEDLRLRRKRKETELKRTTNLLAAAESSQPPAPTDPQLQELLELLPTFLRHTLGPSLTIGAVTADVCELVVSPGIAQLLQPHIPKVESAVKQAFGTPLAIRVEASA